MNYSGVASQKPEGGMFRVGFPGAPDSPVRQTRAAFGCLLLLSFKPFLGLYFGLCWAIQPPKIVRKRFGPISLSISPILVIDANTNQSKYISVELN
jgi:hypothetical protein